MRNKKQNRCSQQHEECPMSKLLHILAGQWTLYILWILKNNGPQRFGVLKEAVEGVSSRVLTERLRLLVEERFLDRDYSPTVPPQVTYSLTPRAEELYSALDSLSDLADKWYTEDSKAAPRRKKAIKRV